MCHENQTNTKNEEEISAGDNFFFYTHGVVIPIVSIIGLFGRFIGKIGKGN